MAQLFDIKLPSVAANAGAANTAAAMNNNNRRVTVVGADIASYSK